MRGKDTFFLMKAIASRITPAYAGKSDRKAFSQCHQQDHPRLCGEKKSEKVQCVPLQGSPPPMRGKGVRFILESCVTRITPAYAGKSKVQARYCTRK